MFHACQCDTDTGEGGAPLPPQRLDLAQAQALQQNHHPGCSCDCFFTIGTREGMSRSRVLRFIIPSESKGAVAATIGASPRPGGVGVPLIARNLEDEQNARLTCRYAPTSTDSPVESRGRGGVIQLRRFYPKQPYEIPDLIHDTQQTNGIKCHWCCVRLASLSNNSLSPTRLRTA